MSVIHQAAIRYGEKIYTLPRPNRHHHIILLMNSEGLDIVPPEDQGFTLDTGEFVGRVEAAEIALATGQVKELHAPPWLFSEDIF